MTIGGIDEVCRYYVAYVYAVEIVKVPHGSNAGIVNFLIIGFTKVGICLGFMNAKYKTWEPCAYTAIGLALVSLVLTLLFLKESPRWLFDRGNYKKSLSIMRHM